jgi:hypothetical protein
VTNAELAELRGEVFGLKTLLFNCISFIAGQFDDPNSYLDELQTQTVAGIAQGTHDKIRPQNLQIFRASAAGIVVQAIEGTKEVHARVLQPPQRH